MDANQLANQRRYILRHKKPTDIVIEQIKEQIINDTQKENNRFNFLFYFILNIILIKIETIIIFFF